MDIEHYFIQRRRRGFGCEGKAARTTTFLLTTRPTYIEDRIGDETQTPLFRTIDSHRQLTMRRIDRGDVFSGIPLVDRLKEAEERTCGVWGLNIETAETLGFCRFEDGIQEIFAVEPGSRFPDLVNHDAQIVGQSYVLDDEALRDVPETLRN